MGSCQACDGDPLLPMEKGYVKLYRSIADSQIFQSEGLYKVYCWCLIKASYRAQWISVRTGKGHTQVQLEPGQFIFGRDTASRKLNMKPSTLYKRLKKLESIGYLNIQSDTHFSIITIINWDTYQDGSKKSDSQSDSQGTPKEQAGNTYKKEKKIHKNQFTPDDDPYKLARLLHELIVMRRPNAKPPNLQTWASEIDKMIRVDKRDPKEIEAVIRWCQKDRFWQNNILSTDKLRKQFDQLALKMEGGNGKGTDEPVPPYTKEYLN